MPSGFLCLVLSAALVLPAPAYALRPAGLEESSTRAELAGQLTGSALETAAEIIRTLRLVPELNRPSEELVRDFIRQLEAGDARKAPEAFVNLLTAHREYVAGFRLAEVQGRPAEAALLEALLADSRRVVEHVGGQLGLTPPEAEQQLGWETIRRLAAALYAARDGQGKLLLGEVHAETLARWFYRELPRRLVPLLAERRRAELASTRALENPFREGNRRSNAVLADLVERRLGAGLLTDNPERLRQDPALIRPWIRLLLASNLVDYSKPGLFEELARQPGETEEERLGSYIERYERTPFLWRERNDQDLDRYLRSVVYGSPRPGRRYLLEAVLGDNNGELALTLKLAEVKLSANPRLRIHLLLKGDNGVMNDASVEDARELLAARPQLFARLLGYERAGRFRILRGPASHGTPLDRIHPRVGRSLRRADAVFLEGEANTVMANGLNADLYLGLRLKHPLVIGPIFGLDPAYVTDSPPVFLHLDGRLGRYYRNPLAPPSSAQRLTIEETWARPTRLEVTVPAGEAVEMALPTGEEVLLEYKKGKVVVSALPDQNGGLPFFTHRERSLRHGAVWNNTLLKTLRGLPGVQAGQKRERAVEEGVYFFPLQMLTQELLPLETVRRLTREGWTPFEISQRLIWDGATPERWRAAAPYVFWDRGPVPSEDGKKVAGELIEIRYREPMPLDAGPAAGLEEISVRMGEAEAQMFRDLSEQIWRRTDANPSSTGGMLRLVSSDSWPEGVPWLDLGPVRISPVRAKKGSGVGSVVATLLTGSWDLEALVQLFGVAVNRDAPRRFTHWDGRVRLFGKISGVQRGQMSAQMEGGRLHLAISAGSQEDLADDVRILLGTVAHLVREAAKLSPKPGPFDVGWLTGAQEVVYSPWRRRLYIAAGGQILEVDPVSGGVTGQQFAGRRFSEDARIFLQINETGRTLFAVEAGLSRTTIWRHYLAGGWKRLAEHRGYGEGLHVAGFAHDPVARRLLILANDEVVFLDAGTGKKLPGPDFALLRPLGIAYDSRRERIYVIQYNRQAPFEYEVAAFNVETGQRLSGWEVPFEGTPQQLFYDPVSDRVGILDSAGLRLAAPVSGQVQRVLKEPLERPRRIAYDPQARNYFLLERFVLQPAGEVGRVRAFSALDGRPVGILPSGSAENPVNLHEAHGVFVGPLHRALQSALVAILGEKDAVGHPAVEEILLNGQPVKLFPERVDTVIEIGRILEGKQARFERQGRRLNIVSHSAGGSTKLTTGLEEKRVDRALAVGREAIQGPGVVVIDAAIFSQQAGLEELLARLPAEGRFIIVGVSASAQEVRARNPAVILVPDAQAAVPAILSLRTSEKVYVLGGVDLTRLLQLYLRDFLIEVSQLDLRLGLKVILLALEVPEEVLRRLDWETVESALGSLEAA